jgi:type II secretory pathway pseudopilin PulG
MFRRNAEDGFSLIEICIGIIIVGLLTAAFARFADVSLQQKREQDLKIGLDELRDALADYEKNPQHPYLPCPAPLTAQNSSNAFGRSVTCDGANHNDGTFVATGRARLKIRIGAVPIRDLGISSDMMLDPWYRRITYAVTEQNTTAAGAASEGAITVNDGFRNSETVPAGIVPYVVFSAGPDGAGAYSTEGKLFAACDNGSKDGQNCAHGGTFIDADRSDPVGAQHYDDRLIYGAQSSAGIPHCGIGEVVTADGSKFSCTPIATCSGTSCCLFGGVCFETSASQN